MKHKKLVLLCCITAIGAILRALLVKTGVDIDDVTTVYIAEAPNIGELIDRVRNLEFGPPLYFMILSVLIRLFGDSSANLVIPSMVFGVGLIPCVFLLAKELFERDDVAMISAFFTAVSPLAVLFSREVRSSSLIALVSTIAFLFFIRCLKATRKLRLMGLGISIVLMLYTNYFALLLVALMVLNTLAYTRFPFKSVVFKPLAILGTISGALVCFTPWIPIFLEQEQSAPFWTYQESINNPLFLYTSNLAATLPIPWNASFVLLSFLLPIAGLIIAWKTMRLIWRRDLINYIDHHKGHAFLLANLLIPILGYAYITPVVGSQRYIMSFVVFGLIFWATLVVAAAENIRVRLAERSSTRRTVAVLALALMLISFTFVEINGARDGDRSGLRQFAIDWKAKKFKHAAVLLAPDFDSYNLVYYLTKEQKAQLPEFYNTFPVPSTITPAKPKGYLEALNDDGAISKTLRWLEHLDVSKVQKLVLIIDQTEPYAKLPLAKERVSTLVERISAQYKPIGQPEAYNSRGRSFSVLSFKLAEPPD